MRLKPGVDWRGVHPAIWIYLTLIAQDHRAWTEEELVVTSLRRPQGDRPTRHFAKAGELVTAADFRRWHLDAAGVAELFCRSLQARYGDDIGVVLEPEWLTAEELEQRGGPLNVEPHVHVQLKRSGWPAV